MADRGRREGAESGVGRRVRVVAVVVVAMVLVAMMALASRASGEPGGGEAANPGPVVAVIHLVEIVAIAVEILGVVLLAVALIVGRRKKPDDDDQLYLEPVRVHWAIRAVMAALPFLVLGGLVLLVSRMRPIGQAEEPLLGAPAPAPPPGGFVSEVAANLGLAWWEVLIGVGLAVVVLVVVVRAFRSPPVGPGRAPEPPRPKQEVAAAVAAGLRDARREADPRRAVIAAYATMEGMLTAAGMPRRVFEAPLEYMGRLFAELDVSGDAIRTLTDLFELARFSQHEISPAMKARAIAALARIDEELRPTR